MVAAKRELRAAAVALRLEGKSYREIGDVVPVSKSTLSLWLRDVPLTDAHRLRLNGLKSAGSLAAAHATRARRVRRTELVQAAAAAEVGAIRERELFLLGVVAYWCEGTKAKPWTPSQQAVFINSDPGLIRLFVAWLRLLGVPRGDLVYRLSIHETADIPAATRFWAEIVGIDPSAFRTPTIKRHKPTTVRRNVDVGYFGCLTVKVRRSCELNRRIAGWWRGVELAMQPRRTIEEESSGVVQRQDV